MAKPTRPARKSTKSRERTHHRRRAANKRSDELVDLLPVEHELRRITKALERVVVEGPERRRHDYDKIVALHDALKQSVELMEDLAPSSAAFLGSGPEGDPFPPDRPKPTPSPRGPIRKRMRD